ncbi:MAG: OmpA family protein, partial [Endomicrobia bacterium]|nr:OmpA family protein [Endomicrobiia bacterium]
EKKAAYKKAKEEQRARQAEEARKIKEKKAAEAEAIKQAEALEKARQAEEERLIKEALIAEQERMKAEEEARRAKQEAQEYEARIKEAQERAKRQMAIDADDKDAMAQAREEARKRREQPMLKRISLDMESFAAGSAELTEKTKELIAKEAEAIKKFDYKNITVEGHTDSTGSAEQNKILSTQRARAVYEEFVIFNKIPANKINYVGFGATIPKGDNKTREGRSQNRRVEIFVE